MATAARKDQFIIKKRSITSNYASQKENNTNCSVSSMLDKNDDANANLYKSENGN